MTQFSVMPGQPPVSSLPPPSRWERVSMFIEDVLIVLAVVFLLCMMLIPLRGPTWTIVMYATLVVMIVVAFRRLQRVRRASKKREEGE